MFLQVHYLTSYHASLLNRDDAGLAKRIRFGGRDRLRISSQCLKRHWREWMTQNTALPTGLRSRHFFSREVLKRLVGSGMDESMARTLILHLAKGILVASGDKEALDPNTLEMKQPVLFGRPEADYMVGLIQQAVNMGDENAAKAFLDQQIKDGKKNFSALLKQAGIESPAVGFEGALFGRFITSDVLARTDAPVHVAHAFTVHELDTEVDFFTVVDDLAEEQETGAAHANDMELGAGIFYGYVVVDVPLLVSNLTGCEPNDWRNRDPESARALLDLLIRAIAQITPGAKLGATAPYARAECVVIEAGTAQPRSLANAFLNPVNMALGKTSPMESAVSAMARYLDALEGMYGSGDERRAIASLHPWPRSEENIVPLQEAIKYSLDYVFGS
jgi:CRISPR system Cascade subunit CasC